MSVASFKPPFTLQSAIAKVQAAEDAWNSQEPERIALAYSIDSSWRNRDTFLQGRESIVRFLSAKWQRELDYRLVKSLWAFTDARIAVRFQYEYHDSTGQWYRAYGNENWEYNAEGLMQRREASINDLKITAADRKFHWSSGQPRPRGEFEIADIQ